MNTPQTVTNATARLTMDSVNRLIEMEVNAATAKLRGENERMRITNRDMQATIMAHQNRNSAIGLRAGQVMVAIGVGCGIVGVIAGYFAAGVLMR